MIFHVSLEQELTAGSQPHCSHFPQRIKSTLYF
jgi:hypothetical protein